MRGGIDLHGAFNSRVITPIPEVGFTYDADNEKMRRRSYSPLDYCFMKLMYPVIRAYGREDYVTVRWPAVYYVVMGVLKWIEN